MKLLLDYGCNPSAAFPNSRSVTTHPHKLHHWCSHTENIHISIILTLNMFTHIHTHTCTHSHTHLSHMCTYTHTHTHTHSHVTHTHTHTHILLTKLMCLSCRECPLTLAAEKGFSDLAQLLISRFVPHTQLF